MTHARHERTASKFSLLPLNSPTGPILEAQPRLGVAEVWFWIDGRFWIYRQVDGQFEERSRSAALTGIDLDEVARIVIATDDSEQAEAVRAYRRSLRRR
jgi:hypothetical protein